MSRLIGSILLMLGTCVGAAMLALPIVTAGQPMPIVFLMLFGCWILMSLGAWALFASTKNQPLSANLLSLSASLGKPVRLITWFAYLLLLYALICAYLSGSSDLVQAGLRSWHWPCPRWLATLIATVCLSALVYRGITWVDWTNRFLMGAKLLLVFGLLTVIAPHVGATHLAKTQAHWPPFSVLMVIVTAFGFAVIVPSLRQYLNDDRRKLAWALGIGSTLPLLLYCVWISLVQASVPWSGSHGLLAMGSGSHATTQLMHALQVVTHMPWLHPVAVWFVSLCALTAFLSVSVCLIDFLADGIPALALPKRRLCLIALTYLPPMFVVLLKPGLFVIALSWAGYCCLYILILLPLAMWVFSKISQRSSR